MQLRYTISLAALALAGCAFSPVRLFQDKVPAPLAKAAVQVEAERAGADLIARKIETPRELIPVAQKLSTSLGAPAKLFDMPVASAAVAASVALDKGSADMSRKLDMLNAKLAGLQGKEIEGTGLSLLGPGMAAVVIGLIALGVVFPPAFTFLLFAFKRLRAASKTIVQTIDEQEDPEVVAALTKVKGQLAEKMDLSHKKVIHNLQKPV